MFVSKCGAAILYTIGLTAVFSLLNLAVYGVLLGFEGWDQPLYAIETFQDTPFYGTVSQFYLLSCGMKTIGFSILALLLLLLSACLQRTLYPCILGVGAGILTAYLSGWVASPVWWKGLLAAISPLSLTRSWDLWSCLCGDRLGSMYLPRSFTVLLIQLALASVLLRAVRRKSC